MLRLQSQGKLYVVGIGAGKGLLTLKALEAIEKSEYIVGYKRYVEEISDFIKHKKLVTTGMREEMKRVEIAVELAKNSVVSLVSGGDPSIYGILPFVYEYLMERNIDVDIEVIPGVSAVNAVSSLLGCPISGDHVVISLSDLLVPWNVIESRLVYALQGDFVIAIYNPSSSSRRRNLVKAMELIYALRGDLQIGVVKNAFRNGQNVSLMRVSEIIENPEVIDMNTTLIVPNSETIVKNGKMFTPRKSRVAKMGAKTIKAVEIAEKSSEILRKFVPGNTLKDEILRRCIATTGDPSFAEIVQFKGDPEEGVKTIRDGARIIVDVKMVKVGLRASSICATDFAEGDDTRTASGFRKIAKLIEGSVVAIGNSPSAAIAVYELAEKYRPRFIVATPVGFVNAEESKLRISSLDLPSITTKGSKGGSNVCAAILNCLIEYAERSD
ncbi:MAG: precorrin-3B C(17)-methyltransferase [Archaeoglobaceae archaeon]